MKANDLPIRIEKRIGKIKAARFGDGGYQDACIGVTFDLGSDKDSWGVGDFWGAWAIERSEYCKWTEEDRIRQLGEMVMRLNGILRDAKVGSVAELAGTPIEVTFDSNTLKEWRVLTEVI
jgi:hypothetical protein